MDELVHGSTFVFRGRVTSVHSEWRGAGTQQRPATMVKFAVERVLKGDSGVSTLTLEFMGGEIGTRRVEIAGMPRFAEGERGVFFVENRNGRLCPLMRLRHGRYRVVQDHSTGVERVARDDGSALQSTFEVAAPFDHVRGTARALPPGKAMELATFEDAVTSRVRHQPANPVIAK